MLTATGSFLLVWGAAAGGSRVEPALSTAPAPPPVRVRRVGLQVPRIVAKASCSAVRSPIHDPSGEYARIRTRARGARLRDPGRCLGPGHRGRGGGAPRRSDPVPAAARTPRAARRHADVHR